MIAFNFVSVEEAKEFKAVVDEKLVVRRRREGTGIILITFFYEVMNNYLISFWLSDKLIRGLATFAVC